jgi:hypothetical protein
MNLKTTASHQKPLFLFLPPIELSRMNEVPVKEK